MNIFYSSKTPLVYNTHRSAQRRARRAGIISARQQRKANKLHRKLLKQAI